MKPKKIELAGRLERRDSTGDKPAAKGNYGANRLGITSTPEGDGATHTAGGGCATGNAGQTAAARLANIAEPFDLPQAPAGHCTASDQQTPAVRSHDAVARELPDLRPHVLAPALDFCDAESAVERSLPAEPTQAPIVSLLGRLPAKKLLAAGGGVLAIVLGCVLVHAIGRPARQASATSIPAISAIGTSASVSPIPKHAAKNRFAPPPKPVVKQAFLAVVDRGELEMRSFLVEGRQTAMLTARTWSAVSALFAPPAPVDKTAAPAGPMAAAAPKKFRDCPPGLRLSGVIATPTGRYATINDRLVKAGDEVDGAKIVAITDFSVEMELAGEHFLVGIGQGALPPAVEPDEPADDMPKDKASDKDAAKKADKPSADSPPADTDKSAKPKSKPKRKPPTADTPQ